MQPRPQRPVKRCDPVCFALLALYEKWVAKERAASRRRLSQGQGKPSDRRWPPRLRREIAAGNRSLVERLIGSRTGVRRRL